MLADIAGLVRDLDPGELTLGDPREADLAVRVTVRHRVIFSVATAAGKGRLPAGVEAVSSRDALGVKLDWLLEKAKQESGGLIDRWADEQTGDYRAALPADRCLASSPVVGVSEGCGACQGHGRLRCPDCRGTKLVTCRTCNGSGQTRCLQCEDGWKTCLTCHGEGFIEKTELELNYTDRQSTPNQQRQLTRRVPCPSNCDRGRQPCGSCDNGMVKCPVTVRCPSCDEEGTISCNDCAATGVIRLTGWILCEVRRERWVEVDSAHPEDQQTLREMPFDQIGRLATNTGGIWANRGVLLSRRERDGLALTAWYSASVRLESVEATAGGERVTIRAYGPQREVFHYHHLIERLLEADLVNLEKAVLGVSFTAGSSLASVMRRFLASEVNGKIAEAPASVDSFVKKEMLGAGYVQRAQAAVAKAAPRLYGPLALPMALWGTGGLIGIFLVVNFLGWSTNLMFFGLAGITALAWLWVENTMRTALREILGAVVCERLKAHFDKARNYYRVAPAVGFFFAWFMALLIFRIV